MMTGQVIFHNITCIYKITNTFNKIYIGQTINYKKRLKQYKNILCKNQVKLYNSLKKYGYSNHKFEILHVCSEKELNVIERYYQELFEVLGKYGLNLKLTNLYDLSGKLSQETKDKIGNSNRGKIIPLEKRNIGYKFSIEHCIKLSFDRKGRKHSEETKKKMSESKKDRIVTQETRDKISNSLKNHIVSEETKLKISNTKKNL